MGKYRGRTNEERAAKNQRQVVECCELPPDGRDFLEQAAVLLTAGTPIDTKHADRGPAAKIHALLSGSSTSAQGAALKALGAGHSLHSRSLQPSHLRCACRICRTHGAGKAFSSSSEVAEAPLQLTVAGLAAVFFDDACWDLTSGVGRAMQALSGRYPDLVTTAVEARCATFVAVAIETPHFERISVLAALLSMRAADAVVRRQWAGIVRAVTSVVGMFLSCASTQAWPAGLLEADCAAICWTRLR